MVATGEIYVILHTPYMIYHGIEAHQSQMSPGLGEVDFQEHIKRFSDPWSRFGRYDTDLRLDRLEGQGHSLLWT